jgi:hypothetical protein
LYLDVVLDSKNVVAASSAKVIARKKLTSMIFFFLICKFLTVCSGHAEKEHQQPNYTTDDSYN